MTLLKDLPEFKETIDNNIFLEQDLNGIITEAEYDVSFDDDKQDIISEIVSEIEKHSVEILIGKDKVGDSIEDKQILAIAIYEILDTHSPTVKLASENEIVKQVINHMSQFVKENYGISIKEGFMQMQGLL